MKLDWTNGVYLDGPRTADWLERWLMRRHGLPVFSPEFGGLSAMGGTTECRAIHRWRAEKATPTVWTLDRMLTKFGGHISQIPDDLWVTERPTQLERGRNVAPEVKVRALELARTKPATEVAEELGVSVRSVRDWKAGRGLRGVERLAA